MPMPPPVMEEVDQYQTRPGMYGAGAPRLNALSRPGAPGSGNFFGGSPRQQNGRGFAPALTPTMGFGGQLRLGSPGGSFVPAVNQQGPLPVPQSVEGRAVRLASARPWRRGNAMGQDEVPPASTIPPVTTTTPNGGAPPPNGGPAPTPNGPPAHAKAWGKLKKLEAEELAQYFADIEKRMQEVEIPPGIVAQMRDRLEAFVETAAPEATFEMTDAEIVELNAAINNLEIKEAQAVQSSTLLWGLLGVGGVTAAVILL